MCGFCNVECYGNMCTCIYCVLYCLCCVFCIVSFMYIYSYLFCTVVVFTCFVMCGCVYVWVLKC